MGSISAVIFDWGGTLTPWHTVDVRSSWRAAVADEEQATRLHQAELDAWVASRDHQRSSSLATVMAAAGVAPEDAFLEGYHGWWEPHTLTDPDVPDLFAGLRQRDIRIGVLSNTLWPRTEHERIFARDDVLALIDGAVYSSEIAHTKPHPEAFRAALAAVGVTDPSGAVFVGDRLYDDIHGAKAVGMRAVLVPHSAIPTDQRGHVEGEPDAVIGRLRELLPIIDRWNS